MDLNFARLAERRLLAARAEGKLSNLAGEGKPLPDRLEPVGVDPLEALGFRIMHEAGFVPQELQLGQLLKEARAEWVAARDPAERDRLMARIADLEMRRNVARETRLNFLRHH
ncbi:MAG: DUF1992 domain-containing protein [Rhodobacterales bacterium]|nr:MAG: DUF1992 domain-containing protein [Rhodobacterales bacterium]